jgi:hypothetical protein
MVAPAVLEGTQEALVAVVMRAARVVGALEGTQAMRRRPVALQARRLGPVETWEE